MYFGNFLYNLNDCVFCLDELYEKSATYFDKQEKINKDLYKDLKERFYYVFNEKHIHKGSAVKLSFFDRI